MSNSHDFLEAEIVGVILNTKGNIRFPHGLVNLMAKEILQRVFYYENWDHVQALLDEKVADSLPDAS